MVNEFVNVRTLTLKSFRFWLWNCRFTTHAYIRVCGEPFSISTDILCVPYCPQIRTSKSKENKHVEIHLLETSYFLKVWGGLIERWTSIHSYSHKKINTCISEGWTEIFDFNHWMEILFCFVFFLQFQHVGKLLCSRANYTHPFASMCDPSHRNYSFRIMRTRTSWHEIDLFSCSSSMIRSILYKRTMVIRNKGRNIFE